MDAQAAMTMSRNLPGIGNVEDATFLGEGDFSHAWLVNGQWVCRFTKNRKAARSMRREACYLPSVASRLPLPVPRPIYHEGLGQSWCVGVHRALVGDIFTRESFLRLDRVHQDRCARDVARFLYALHALDTSDARSCGIRTANYRLRYGAVYRIVQRHLIPRLDRAACEYVHRVFERFLTDDVHHLRNFKVLHGDIRPRHILWNAEDQDVSGVIDFGDIELGDVTWDFVRLSGEYGLDFLRALLRHYRSPDPERLVRRMYRFYELDEIQWAAEVCAGRRSDDIAALCLGIRALQASADEEPWLAALDG